jgi:hypothetical protein
MSLRRKTKPSPAEGEFLFELDPEPLEESVVAYGGIPLLVRTARSPDVPGSDSGLKVKVALIDTVRGGMADNEDYGW